MTITQKLEILFNEMTKLYGEAETSINNNSILNDSKIDSYKLKTIKNKIKIQLFNKLVKISDLNQFPKIIEDANYDNLNGFMFSYMGVVVCANELYRGVRNINHHANLLFDADYHTGIGDISNGLYSSIRYDTALTYSKNYNKDYVLKFKTPYLKVIDDLELQIKLSNILNLNHQFGENENKLLEIRTFFEKITNKNDRENFEELLFDDLGILAILLGYDAVYDHNFPSFALFNRGKIYVSESESERIKTQTVQNAHTMQPCE